MKSMIVEYSGKLFRYDYDRSVVEYIMKADAEEIEFDRQWKAAHGSSIYGIDADGYMVMDSIGLNRKNWDDPAARREYLAGWIVDLDAEAKALVGNFIRYELPYLV